MAQLGHQLFQVKNMGDTLKTAAVGIGGSTITWLEWFPPLMSALGAIATLIYMIIKIYKEIK